MAKTSKTSAKMQKKPADTEPKRPAHRPSEYSPEMGALICEGLVRGKSLRKICESADMPDHHTVINWRTRHSDFDAQYARAREVGLDYLAEIALDEATAAIDPIDVQRAKLALDARKWFLSKLLPRKYGDKITNEHTGPDGQPIGLQPVRPAMSPQEAIDYVRGIFAETEHILALPSGDGVPDKDRLQAIVQSGRPLPPQLYRLLHADVKDD